MSNLYSRIAHKPAKRLDNMAVSQTNAWMNGKFTFLLTLQMLDLKLGQLLGQSFRRNILDRGGQNNDLFIA